MANLNKVFLIGNLTRDPELRYTPSGTAVAEFGLAVNRTWNDRDGQKKEEVCFVDLQAWARSAEVISEYCRKGRPLFVEGRLRYETWEGRDGQKRSKLRIVVENFQFLGGRRDENKDSGGQRTARPSAPPPPSGPPGDEPSQAPYQVDDDIPF